MPHEQETVSRCAMQHLQRPAERDPVHRKLTIVFNGANFRLRSGDSSVQLAIT